MGHDEGVMTPHLDADALVLRAMGERPGPPEQDTVDDLHLANCAACQVELDQLAAVARTARSVTPQDSPIAPPASVWAGISKELGVGDNVAVLPVDARPRRRGWLVGVAAAAAGALVGGAAVLGVTADRDGSAAPQATSVATTALDPLGGATARGRAAVLSDGPARSVQVDVSGLTPTAGYYEVWLLDKSAKRLVALGTLDSSDQGIFTIPGDVSLTEFPVVDVSLEPADGNPGHSGDSIVRGTLST
jgi:hypothetical protein